MVNIKAFMGKIDTLSIRERGIILAAIIFVMFSVWNSFFMQPKLVEERKILADLQIKRTEQTVINIKLQGLIKQNKGAPVSDNRGRLAELQEQLDEIELNVRQSTKHLVTPEKMAMILQSILNKSRGLELIEIKGLGVSPLLTVVTPELQTKKTDETGNQSAQSAAGAGFENAYKHGLVIKFEGDYMATLAYMRELESLEWGFFWENLEYEVTEYPTGKVSLTLYTLSLDKDWIGV